MVSRQKVIERRERRSKVEKLMLSGVTSQKEIAARFNVGTTTIHRDMRAIEQSWQLRNRKTSEKRRARRILQLEAIMLQAWNSYQKSLQDEETVTIKTENGKEVTTRTLRGQSGNPAFLRVAKDCVSELAKIEGLQVQKHEHSGPQGGPIELAVYQEAARQMSSEELGHFINAARRLNQISRNATLVVDGTVETNGNGHRPHGGNGSP